MQSSLKPTEYNPNDNTLNFRPIYINYAYANMRSLKINFMIFFNKK